MEELRLKIIQYIFWSYRFLKPQHEFTGIIFNYKGSKWAGELTVPNYIFNECASISHNTTQLLEILLRRLKPIKQDSPQIPFPSRTRTGLGLSRSNFDTA